MEKQENFKRRHVTFYEGDSVLLKFQSYRQSTVNLRESHKIAKIYSGPFRNIKRAGTVTYLLDLPSSSWIHPTVHVSLLKPYHGDHPSTKFQSILLPDLVIFEDESTNMQTQTDLQ